MRRTASYPSPQFMPDMQTSLIAFIFTVLLTTDTVNVSRKNYLNLTTTNMLGLVTNRHKLDNIRDSLRNKSLAFSRRKCRMLLYRVVIGIHGCYNCNRGYGGSIAIFLGWKHAGVHRRCVVLLAILFLHWKKGALYMTQHQISKASISTSRTPRQYRAEDLGTSIISWTFNTQEKERDCGKKK